MKTLTTEIPTKLREELRLIICEACDGAYSADSCDWRSQGKFCSVPDETVDKIHTAYYQAQMRELRNAPAPSSKQGEGTE